MLLTRTSDFMMSHLKAFREVSGDSRWDKVIDKTYSIMESVYKEYSSQTGLLPDFLVNINGKFVPHTTTVLETENDGVIGGHQLWSNISYKAEYFYKRVFGLSLECRQNDSRFKSLEPFCLHSEQTFIIKRFRSVEIESKMSGGLCEERK